MSLITKEDISKQSVKDIAEDICNTMSEYTHKFQGTCTGTLTGHIEGITCLVDLPDGLFASGSWDNTIKIWDIKKRCVKTLIGHSNYITSLVVLPDGSVKISKLSVFLISSI